MMPKNNRQCFRDGSEDGPKEFIGTQINRKNSLLDLPYKVRENKPKSKKEEIIQAFGD
jgi:hypothetical protein